MKNHTILPRSFIHITFLFILVAGMALSWYGEKKALAFPLLPKLPRFEHLNMKVVSAQMATGVLFGGLRGMIVDFVWMYMDNLWHHARFYKLPPLYEFITTIQPEYIDGWVMGGWHMAYNMGLDVVHTAGISPQIAKKIELEWAYRGINFLKAGAILNPDSAKLYFEIGWTYYHRLKDYQASIPWFEKSEALPDASYVTSRLIAFAMEKTGDLKSARQKWLSLTKHPSYNDPSSKSIIDRNISRFNKLSGG
ncbi:MAG: hypothetical protein JW774_13400 [Candidatus Aureabacteria bacterium]|nr:hypothetical protein [Candidatus Auribacterota bacterium]